MFKSVVVFGPRGCGKARNAEALRVKLNMITIFDEGKVSSDAVPPHHGALILTDDPSKFDGFKAISYDDAMRLI